MEEGGGNALFPAEDHRALDHVLKLPDVAGPGVVLQDRRHLSAKPTIRLPNLSVRLLKDARGKRENSAGRSRRGGSTIGKTLRR